MGEDDHLAHTLDLASAMYQYLYARDWEETGEVLAKHPILLTQSAIDLLQDIILELQKRGAHDDVVILQSLMVVLELGRLRGARGVLEEINRIRNLFP